MVEESPLTEEVSKENGFEVRQAVLRGSRAAGYVYETAWKSMRDPETGAPQKFPTRKAAVQSIAFYERQLQEDHETIRKPEIAQATGNDFVLRIGAEQIGEHLEAFRIVAREE